MLNGRPVGTFSAAQLADRAQNRWDRGQLVAATLLFEAAAEASQRDSGPDRSIVYLARAAMTRHEVGDIANARKMFDAVIDFDWLSAGPALLGDSHVVEWAFVARLQTATDPHTFQALYAKAVARCAELGWAFPRIHPKQELLLEHAVSLGCVPVVRVLLERIRGRRPLSRATQDRLQQVQSWLEARASG